MEKISYILVTHNSQDHFPSVINNLKKFTNLKNEIIVIDNNSKDCNYLIGDKIIKNKKNLFFTCAVNQGLKAIDQKTDYIILINPDVRITSFTINKILIDLKNSKAGIAGLILVYPDLTIQHGGGRDYQ